MPESLHQPASRPMRWCECLTSHAASPCDLYGDEWRQRRRARHPVRSWQLQRILLRSGAEPSRINGAFLPQSPTSFCNILMFFSFIFHSFPAQVCYPLKLSGARIVEEDWTLSVNDVHDEIWYSTCYKRELKRVFTGLTTPCMDYVSTDFPDGMCNLDLTPYWRHECVVALLRCLFLFSFALSLCYLTSLLLSHVSP